MSAHTIIFHNNSNHHQHIALFAAVPHVLCEDGGRMWSPAWIIRTVAGHASERIQVESDVYAWHDLDKLDNFGLGTVVTGGTSMPARLGRRTGAGRRKTLLPGSSFKTEACSQRRPLLMEAESQADDGQLSIHVHEVRAPQLIGIAKRGDNDAVLPVMAMRATPSYTYGIRPKTAYYLAVLPHVTRIGQVLDLRSVRTKTLIDFDSEAATSSPMASLTWNADGRFDLDFSGLSCPSTPSSDVFSGQLPVGRGLKYWHGSVVYPSTASSSSAAPRVGAIIDRLSGKYAWSVTTSQTRSGGIATRVFFWLENPGGERQDDRQYQEDWNAAVAASRAKVDGLTEQTNLGCLPGTPHRSFDRLPLVTH